MTSETLKESLKYVSNDKKTESSLITGILCTPETAFEEMLATKVAWGKTDGRQHIQFIQSFAPDDPVMPKTAHEIGVKLAQSVIPKGFQALVATHVDRDHIHNHIVINSVNMDTGLKWKQGREFLLLVRDESDKLCLDYNLSIVPPPKSRDEKAALRGEYEAAQDGRSWKHELRLVVQTCLRESINRGEFISNMNRLGYKVTWSDERKHVTFTTPDGKKCRGRMLGSRYSKDAMEAQFERNKLHRNEKKRDAKFDLLCEVIQNLRNLHDPITDEKSNVAKFPLTAIEGQAKKEKAISLTDKGLDWDRR